MSLIFNNSIYTTPTPIMYYVKLVKLSRVGQEIFDSEHQWVFGCEAAKSSLEWVLMTEPSILNVFIEYKQ